MTATRRLRAWAGLVLAAIGGGTGAQAQGLISGKVEVQGGPAGGSMFVQWSRESQGPADSAATGGMAAVGADGKFEVRDVAAGRFALCVRAPGLAVLDPCIWEGATELTLSEANAMQATGLRIEIKKGVRLQLAFEDPNSLLRSNDNPGGAGGVSAGLWLPNGNFVPMPAVERKKGTWLFEAAVPENIYARVAIERRNVRVTQTQVQDERDRILYPESPAGFAVSTGKNATRRFTFAVSPVAQ